MKELIKKYLEFCKQDNADLLIIDEFTYDLTEEILIEMFGLLKARKPDYLFYIKNTTVRFLGGNLQYCSLTGLDFKYIIAKIKPENFSMIAPMFCRHKDCKYNINIVKEV